nr:hypothetical protein [Tanacetum cinerariifolium]
MVVIVQEGTYVVTYSDPSVAPEQNNQMLYWNMNLIWILRMMIQTSILVILNKDVNKQLINDEDMEDEEDVDVEEGADDNAELEEDDANDGYDEDEDDE